MSAKVRDDIRNLALIAHVDHGKTTLVDSMLWQSGRIGVPAPPGAGATAETAPEREKSIAVMARVTSLAFLGTRINIVDTPGRADFGGEVERSLKMVEGVLLLVDACEGPVPQTRLVLQKALDTGLVPLVVINKIDRAEAKPEETLDEVHALFADLDASAGQRRFPVLYTNALRGICRREPGGREENLLPLFEMILDTVPAPRAEDGAGFRFQATMLDYDDFLGRLALCRD